MRAAVDHQQFVTLLEIELPEVAATIGDCSRGLLYCEMTQFAKATQAAIQAEDVETVRRHFRFAEHLLREAGADVRKAIGVSYLEHIAFDGRHGKKIKARDLMLPHMRKAVADREAYAKRLFGEFAGV